MFCKTCKTKQKQLYKEENGSFIFCGEPCQQEFHFSLIGAFEPYFIFEGPFWSYIQYMTSQENFKDFLYHLELTSAATRDNVFRFIKNDNIKIEKFFKLTKDEFYKRMSLVASEFGYIKILTTLIDDIKIDPSISDDYGNYAILLASRYNQLKVVELLLKDGKVDPSIVDDYGNYAILLASENGHVKVVELLLQDKRVDASADNNEVIVKAAQNGHVKVAELLINNEKVKKTFSKNEAEELKQELEDDNPVKNLLRLYILALERPEQAESRFKNVKLNNPIFF
jgi:ankyrin repeat protein